MWSGVRYPMVIRLDESRPHCGLHVKNANAGTCLVIRLDESRPHCGWDLERAANVRLLR